MARISFKNIILMPTLEIAFEQGIHLSRSLSFNYENYFICFVNQWTLNFGVDDNSF